MTYWIAVDGGNSKTDVLIGDVDGNVLAAVRGPGSSPQTLGVQPALRLLAELFDRARTGAGLSGPLDRADLYLAGVDLPEEVEAVSAAVSETGWARAYHVDNDTFALLRAGTDEPDAVAVVCGAGINCVGRTADGRSARFPALGMLSGDWGGGQHLASLALWHAARGEDGRGPATALAGAVAGHCGVRTIAEVVAGVHLGTIPKDILDDLSALLFTVAAAGDPVARRVVDRQAKEIVALATVAANRLGLRDSRFAVVLGGGVLRAQHPLLHEAVTEGILAHSPVAEVCVLTQPPVLGAGLFALDALGATPRSHSALRERAFSPAFATG
ncbi:N-acetylglucosamine kinase [Allorhizocola rhizosphaerae]|uniref:N-acetylglucosamine kinase n=1 Tax=Allorhizocola rhizosphaerae TaxID=1872709 RepID=UPI0013C2A7C9|nr:BadF/BadG/BcrA/BcrD ATPase family protein [Allorhizocola rhizosphaerae]